MKKIFINFIMWIWTSEKFIPDQEKKSVLWIRIRKADPYPLLKVLDPDPSRDLKPDVNINKDY
jgi:hypothetical protein